jgi:hypothetical protein
MEKIFKNPSLFTLLIFLPTLIFSQTPPPLGTTSSFVLFSSVGAITNLGLSQVTGDFGTNSGAVSGFGNVNGQMHIANATSSQAATDLGIAYNDLNNQIPGDTLGLVLGNGQTLLSNVYVAPGASSLIGTLTLDGCGDPNACFVIQINGAFSTSASSKIVLSNGTKACNVFWRVDGQMSMATNTSFKGTIIGFGAIPIDAGVHLEGRALSVSGAVSVSSLTADIPLGCIGPIFIGPGSPNMSTVECFALITSNGTVTNTGTTNVIGDVGTNNGTVSGFNPLGVAGVVHSTPDGATAQASSDLTTLHAYLDGLSPEIELLYPVLFGNSQVLTPHVYIMNAAAKLTDTIFLDSRGVPGAVFVIRIMGALTTNTNPQVVLVGGTQVNNVFWQVEGAVTIESGASFNGIIVANNGSIVLNTGVTLNGRALSTTGDVTTENVNITGTNAVGVASSTPALCINTELTAIKHASTGATGIGPATGFPTGVTAAWSANTITISGTPTTSGTFNYSIPLTGGCGSVNATGTITVNPFNATTPSNTVSAASSSPTVCINTALTGITHTTTGATGIGTVTGLPVGVTAAWTANIITISGTPTALGTFNYSIPLTGGCGSVNATGTIIVTTVITNTASASSSLTFCLNTAFSYISHNTTGATGIGTASSLPAGVSATWSSNTITISGTPTTSGTFNYSIPLTGGCGCVNAGGCDCVNATGTIIVSVFAGPTAKLATTSDTICHGVKVTLSGNITATGVWTLTLSNGQTTTGSGNGVWNIVVIPTSTTTYTISSIVDTGSCQGTPSGSTTLTLPPAGASMSNDNESSTCVVNQTGWVHYYHSSGRLIASINSVGQNLGTVSVTSYLDATVQTITACYNPNPEYATSVMQRHWVISPSIQPTTQVLVRLPFTNIELTNLSGIANVNLNVDDDVNTIADIKLSKYSGPSNVDNNATNNCISEGGNEGTTIHTQVATGNTTEYSSITSTQYTDFSISGFSEFWLHASSTNSPLPIDLLSFTAEAKDAYVQLNWVTVSEINNDYFNIERSSDAINFTSISTINGAGNSSQILNYSTVDHAPLNGKAYYRLKQTDYDGKSSYSNITTIEFNNINGFDFEIYPNPNDGENFNFEMSYKNAEVLVVVYDILGKEMYSKVIITSENDKDVYAIDPSQKLNPGVYLIIATSSNAIYKKRLIVK